MPLNVASTPQLQLLIFDVDGTLADTEEAHRLAFNQAFAEAGLDWHWDVELYRELLAVTGGKERILHYMRQYRPDWRPGAPAADFAAELHAAKTAHYHALVERGGVALRPGILRLLTAARAEGLRLAIATTTSLSNVLALLTTTIGPEAPAWFDCIAAGDVVGAKKPAPDIYRYCLEQLRMAPEQCLAIEDSANGLRSAMAAGLTTLVTANLYTRDDDFSGAAMLLDHLGEPDCPCSPSISELAGRPFVDVEFLHRLHGRYRAA